MAQAIFQGVVVRSIVWLLLPCLLWPAFAFAQASAPPTPPPGQAENNFSYVRYRADYEVREDASNVETDSYEILLKTKSAVEHFSQVRLSYSEKMETLEVLEAYTITAEGLRQPVPADRIYTQESYSSASAAMYADRKVRVIVFPNLAPGARIAYVVRRSQHTPFFPGYFSLWETFSVFSQYQEAVVTLTAPERLPMQVWARGVEAQRPVRRQGQQRWEWRYQRPVPMKSQNWSAAAWEFSPTIMASTYRDWSQMGLAYHAKAGQAAAVTPKIQALAEQITAGIPASDRRAQAAALYDWVARNIRYVAVYLGNGGLEPNPAERIADSQYGDCKDHTVILEALLAAKGIASTPVLIGADGGPTLPRIAVLGRFNHAITYLPEFDLYVDSTNPYARFGQLPASDLGAPVVHSADGRIARTPANDRSRNAYVARSEFDFRNDGGVSGLTTLDSGQTGEIGLRAMFVQLNAQNRVRIEESIIAQAGFDGRGELEMQGDPLDLSQPFGYRYGFQAEDYVDFQQIGGMRLPDMPGAESARDLYASTSSETNLTPFYCNDSLRQETYVLRFPDGVPIAVLPRDAEFSNAAGEYSVHWQREGQTVTSTHRLARKAIHGPQQLCQPQDYAAFRELFQQVRRGFRSQIVYGDLTPR